MNDFRLKPRHTQARTTVHEQTKGTNTSYLRLTLEIRHALGSSYLRDNAGTFENVLAEERKEQRKRGQHVNVHNVGVIDARCPHIHVWHFQ
jgi:hypothetical protein